jgi:Rha family phage regulatory protein
MNLIEQNGVFYVDSRQVAEITDKRHDHLVRDIDGYIKVLGKNPNLGASNFFVESTYKQAGNGKEVRCYLLTKKGCDMVANKMSGEKGVLFTATYISKFYEMEHQIEKRNNQLALPKDYPSALRALANEYEAKQKALAENAIMKPKADFYDTVVSTESLLSMGDTAKLINKKGVGRNNLYKILKARKILMADNIPYQQYIERGYFKVVENYYMAGDNKVITKTTYVKQKGVDYIRKLLSTEVPA